MNTTPAPESFASGADIFPMGAELLHVLDEAVLVVTSQGEITCLSTAGKKLLDHTGRSTKRLTSLLFTELSLTEVFARRDATPIQLRKVVIGEGAFSVKGVFHQDRLVIVLSDITDKKRMAQDLSGYFIQLLRFQAALQHLPDGIVIADAFERILFMNTAMEKCLAALEIRQRPALLADLEPLLGSLSTEQEPFCMTSEHSDETQLLPAQFVVEKKKLLTGGGKTHGFLLRLSANKAPLSRLVGSLSSSVAEQEAPQAFGKMSSERANMRTLTSFVGQSKAVQQIKTIVKKVAPTPSTVLLQSETGTGKELLARSLHELSGRASGPFIKLNCASLPESLLEAEIFGYDSGAFTGAKKSGNPGLFEQAHTGTIFLDELGEMSLTLQAKLLRIIQEREVQRIGGQNLKRLDVRVVCATNRNLLQLVEKGIFRSDLFFRINVVSISIPPLRERKEDIKSLIIYFLREYSQQFKKNVNGISKEVFYIFMHYDWPGNVRELGNILEYSFNIVDGHTIEVQHLPQYILDSPKTLGGHSGRLCDLVGAYSRQVILKTLERHDGNKAAAAAALGISRATLYRLLTQ